MTQVISLHIADLGFDSGRLLIAGAPAAGSIPGLLNAEIDSAAHLAGPIHHKLLPGRVILTTFWESREHAEAFDRTHRLAQAFRLGWRAQLAPLRAYGTWPGLSDSLPSGRNTSYDGPVVALTLGRLRLKHAVRFLLESAPAERAATAADGFLWGTALARPPFVSTISVWESTRAVAQYAYGKADAAHRDVIASDARRPFHHRSAFIRLRPLHVEGTLPSPNPLATNAVRLPDCHRENPW